MSGHTFGARLYILRDRVMGWSRERLAKRLRERTAKLPPDDADELRSVTRDDIREWERGEKEPSYIAKRFVAQVLGFRQEVLDPEESALGLSPQGLLALARAKGLSRGEINYTWNFTQHRIFEGNPGPGEWFSIIEQMTGAGPIQHQEQLFTNGFWCTHCGGWIPRHDRACPDCGNVE